MDVRLPRRERERLRHRQEILDAARKVIADRGIEGLTVDLVAREADFAVGSIYRHFRSKEDLVEVLLAEFVEPLLEEMEAVRGGDFSSRLEHLVRLVHAHRVEAAPLFRLFLSVPGDLPSFESPRMRGVLARHFAALDALLAVGQAEGALPPGPRGPMVVALGGLMDAFTKCAVIEPAVVDGDLPALVCTAFLHGFGVKS